ncbi:MAG: hypothetical protein ACUVUC_01580 [Thermoguttaceae bacterium]
MARDFFKKVLTQDPEQLAALVDELGSPVFIELGSRQDVQPEGRLLAEAVLKATARQLQDPQRIAALIKDLQSAEPQTRERALIGLREAQQAAFGALFQVLADRQRVREHSAVRAALGRLGPEVVDPLLAALEAKDGRLAAEAATLIGEMSDPGLAESLFAPLWRQTAGPELRAAARRAVIKLLGDVPTPQQAAGRLAERARRYLEQAEPLPADLSAMVRIWSWDEQARQPVASALPADQARRWFAARAARDAYAILPENAELRRLYAMAILEEAAYRNGLDKPLPMDRHGPAGQCAALGLSVLEDALARSIEQGHCGAAAAAARILGWQPEAERLLRRSGQPCPLVLATRHADLRVRFAAVEAVARLQPAEPFPGASYVVEALGFLAASTGARRALVASPSLEQSRRVSGYLAALGYQVDWATTGRELIRLALRSPDYELAMIDAGIDQPTLEFVVQQLRRDGRTAWMPIGIFARDEQMNRARHVAETNPRVKAFYPPQDPKAAQWQLQGLAALAGPQPVTAAERQRYAAKALEWLDQLGGQPGRKFYDLKRVQGPVLGALEVPELSSRAAAVLGKLGTADSQRALVELASRPAAPIPSRLAALAAFRQSSQQFGILLTIDQIRLQYDRYRQSADQDTASQRLLGLILECLEASAPAPRPPDEVAHEQGGTDSSVMP